MSVKQQHYPPKTAYARPCDRTKVFAVRSLAYMEPKCLVPCSEEPDKAPYPATNPVIYAFVLLRVFRSDLYTGLHTLFYTKHKPNTVYLCKKRVDLKCKIQPRVNSFYVKQFSIWRMFSKIL
jgi:hypothetical protein